MNRVRIEFLKGDQVIKTFDRSVHEKAEAAQLAEDIARDSGVAHDSKRVVFERKFKATIAVTEGTPTFIESKAFDEADAQAQTAKWMAAAKITGTVSRVRFLEA